MRSLLDFLVGSAILFSIVILIFFRNNLWSFLTNLKNPADSQIIQNLKLENEKLKKENQEQEELHSVRQFYIELENLKRGDSNILRFQYLPAQIYSRYPFNDRNLIVINVGSADDLREGLPVLAREGILLGRVSSVKRTQSEIQTIFDSNWRSSVGIGNTRIKAVLKGGFTPKLELIAKDEEILQGDDIFNLSPDFPLNLKIGNIKNLESTTDNLWRSANLEIPYKIDELNEVLLVLDFP